MVMMIPIRVRTYLRSVRVKSVGVKTVVRVLSSTLADIFRLLLWRRAFSLAVAAATLATAAALLPPRAVVCQVLNPPSTGGNFWGRSSQKGRLRGPAPATRTGARHADGSTPAVRRFKKFMAEAQVRPLALTFAFALALALTLTLP
jgi:hypothetical protein